MNEQNQGEAVDVDASPIPEEGRELIVREERALGLMPVISMEAAVDRFNQLGTFVQKIMRPGIDFGIIPGTKKPTLLQPGAEKLCTFFGLRTEFVLTDAVKDWQNGFFYFEYTCRLWRNDFIVGEGCGSCNSKEKKYRWRNADRVCPICQNAAIFKGKDQGSGFYCWAKKGGCGAKFPEGDPAIINQVCGQVENTEPYELVNTMQKMGQKRAFVAATKISVNGSEFFTQDTEDLAIDVAEYSQSPAQSPQPRQPSVTRASASVPLSTTANDGGAKPAASPLRQAEAAPVQRQQPAAQPVQAKQPPVQRKSESEKEQFSVQGRLKRAVYAKQTSNGSMRYGIQLEDGTWYNSWAENIQIECDSIFHDGGEVVIHFTRNGDWSDIVGIQRVLRVDQPAMVSEESLPF